MMQYRFHSEAVAELEAAGEWYDLRTPHAVVDSYYDAVMKTIRLIRQHPKSYRLRDHGVRHAGLQNFPFQSSI